MTVNLSENPKRAAEALSFLEGKLHKAMGLNLVEDDHILILKAGESVIARWSATGVTAKEIRDIANSYILNSCSALELQLLHFWENHPRAKFSIGSIARALGITRLELSGAIRALIEKGIVNEKHNGITYFSLNADQQAKEHIEELVKLNQNGIDTPETKLHREPVPV